jgi:DNA polymerase, archaea type
MLVAIEPAKGGVWRYVRDGDSVKREYDPYRPWLLAPSDRSHFLFDKPYRLLEGDGFYNRKIDYAEWKDFYLAYSLSDKEENKVLIYTSATKNYLMDRGEKLFDGAGFDDPVRLVLDIETGGLDPATAPVFMIALLDNRGREEVLVGDEYDILRRLVAVVDDIDPDVIEGHNLIGFDLPFILARMGRHSITPALGRNNGVARIGRLRKMMVGPNERMYQPVFIPGRHVVDTYIQVQKYDSQIMRLSSYGLKAVAREYGIDEPDRIELDREKILDIYKRDPRYVETYALQDVRETKRLAEIILPVEFMQCQYVPDGYQGVTVVGNGEKWNSLLISKYLRASHSIPARQTPASYVGGLVEVHRQGIIGRVVKADVESLYPSLMLTKKIQPSSDVLNVMLPLLTELKEKRIEAKRKMSASEGSVKEYWDGFQQSAKILINSAYGFMGGPFHFGDWQAAERVTLGGREVVARVRDEIAARGGEVVEVDTDGVIFVPPSGCEDKLGEEEFVSLVGQTLPDGIVLAHDGRYKGMLSLRMKNYVLLSYDDKLTIKGASLKSRSAEKFGKEFLEYAIRSLFSERVGDVGARYRDLLGRIYHGRMGLEEIQTRVRITDKTFTSGAKARLGTALAGGSVGDHALVYEREDGSIGLAEEYAGDYDRLHYMQRLHAYASRLKDVLPAFETDYPRPGKRNMHGLVGEPDPPKTPRRANKGAVGRDPREQGAEVHGTLRPPAKPARDATRVLGERVLPPELTPAWAF